MIYKNSEALLESIIRKWYLGRANSIELATLIELKNNIEASDRDFDIHRIADNALYDLHEPFNYINIDFKVMKFNHVRINPTDLI